METTYDPIVSTSGVPRLRLSQNRPTPEPGRALVLFREGDDLTTIWPNKRLTAGEATWGRYRTIHYVDVTDHRLHFEWQLPSKGDAFHFQAEVAVDCTVVDPAKIVEKNVRNVGALVGSLVHQALRNVTRDYGVTDVASAEGAAAKALESVSFGEETGIAIKPGYVRLELEAEASQYKQEAERAAREVERERERIERERERERNEAKHELERIERERQHLARKRDLDTDRAKAAADLKQLEETGEIAVKKLQVAFFKDVLKDPEGLVAFHAAQRPQDIPVIVRMIREQDLARLDRYLDGLRLLIENDALEGHHLEDYALEYVNALKVALEGERSSISGSEPAAVLPQADTAAEPEAVNEEPKASEEETEEEGGGA